MNNELQTLFSQLAGNDTVLAPLDAGNVSIKDLVEDHIYGLFLKGVLTDSEVTLLAALLQYKAS